MRQMRYLVTRIAPARASVTSFLPWKIAKHNSSRERGRADPRRRRNESQRAKSSDTEDTEDQRTGAGGQVTGTARSYSLPATALTTSVCSVLSVSELCELCDPKSYPSLLPLALKPPRELRVVQLDVGRPADRARQRRAGREELADKRAEFGFANLFRQPHRLGGGELRELLVR